MTQETARPADASGVYRLGGDLPVNRLGYGAMQFDLRPTPGRPRRAAVPPRAAARRVTFRDRALKQDEAVQWGVE